MVNDHEIEVPASSSCHQVEILDDVWPEFVEMFFICAQTESTVVHIVTNCTKVHIFDDDSKCTNPLISNHFI